MTSTYAFNGDADGLCALQQLRLAAAAAGGPAGGSVGGETLITGVKRDIALLERVQGGPGVEATVLDVSLDVNRAGLVALLESGATVRYFDHHFAGEIPQHPRLETHIDPDAKVCTSILVDRHLAGQFRRWAAVGAFGDSLIDQGRLLSQEAGLTPEEVDRLAKVGVALNYNDYGETIADLHVPPTELAAEMLKYEDPLKFEAHSAIFHRLAMGFREDMAQASRLEPSLKVQGAIVFELPDAAWARRSSGTLANDLAKAHAGNALAIVSQKTGGGYLVSLRVPGDAKVSAEAFCRRYPTGGGRRTAAGINHLPSEELEAFKTAFAQQFRLS
jgi:hypothetical protein